MWFYPLVLALVILAILGGTVLGGVYTLVLVPLAAVAVISAIGYAMWGRAQSASSGEVSHTPQPLPHSPARPSGRATSSPERLVDARREQQ